MRLCGVAVDVDVGVDVEWNGGVGHLFLPPQIITSHPLLSCPYRSGGMGKSL